MFNKIKNVGKRVKKYMEEKVEACKEFIRDDKNRLIMGLVILGAGLGLGVGVVGIGVGIGGGLIASVYIKVPQ